LFNCYTVWLVPVRSKDIKVLKFENRERGDRKVSKEKFEIGEKEKHYLTVDWDMITKHIKIEEDDVVVVNKSHLSPLAKKFQFDIGSSEQHHIQIIVGQFHPVELKVDGEKVRPLL